MNQSSFQNVRGYLKIFIFSVGPFFIVSQSNLIGKAFGNSWMEALVQNGSLVLPVGIILMIYAFIIAEITIRESKKYSNSGIQLIPYPIVWVPIVLYMSLLTGVILFVSEVFITIRDLAEIPVPNGYKILEYMVGFLGPLPMIAIFKPSMFKTILKTKSIIGKD